MKPIDPPGWKQLRELGEKVHRHYQKNLAGLKAQTFRVMVAE